MAYNLDYKSAGIKNDDDDSIPLSQKSNIILYGLVGSHAYGLATPKSDHDYMGVFVNRSSDYWRIDKKPAEHGGEGNDDCDIKLFEIEKYMKLLSKCNPTIMDLLWLDETIIQQFAGTMIRTIRKSFLSKHCKNSYFGYAKAQFNMWEKESRFKKGRHKEDAKMQKHIRHTFRLYEQYESLVTDGKLKIRITDPEFYLNELPAMPKDDILKLAKEREDKLHNIEVPFDDEPDWDTVNDCFSSIRRIFM